MLTIKLAMEKLQKIAKISPLGEETVLCVCIPGIEYQTISEIKLEKSDDGAIALIMQPFDLDYFQQLINQFNYWYNRISCNEP
jgi:hypothetical protein